MQPDVSVAMGDDQQWQSASLIPTHGVALNKLPLTESGEFKTYSEEVHEMNFQSSVETKIVFVYILKFNYVQKAF